MIHHAIYAEEYSLDRMRMQLTLSLQFQLGKGVFVKGVLELGDALPIVNDEDFKLVN